LRILDFISLFYDSPLGSTDLCERLPETFVFLIVKIKHFLRSFTTVSASNSHLVSASSNMADQLNMNGLNLGGAGEPRSYIPPHMRGKMGGPAPAAPAANGGMNGSAWAAPAA
jgi:hypothetical protein